MIWYDILACTISGALITIASIGIAYSILSPAVDRWNKHYMIILFSSMLVCAGLSFVAGVIYGNPDVTELYTALGYVMFWLLYFLILMPIIFLVRSTGESVQESLLFKVAMVLSLPYFIMLIPAPFTTAFFTITNDTIFERGPLWPLLLLPLFGIVALEIIGTVRRRKTMPRRYFIAFLVFLPPLAITLFFHSFFEIELTIYMAVGLWGLATLATLAQENTEKRIRQQQQIASQHASILVLQMRPHFIYNTMTSIYYLCQEDPEKAQSVTLDFTTYLRKNFAAIASESTIPFADELEHTRAYLSVEMAQFEDSLFVAFDTPHTQFHLPPLTLQPIVENAVKHGMEGSDSPIHISIKTRKTEKHSEIIVEDDGAGFHDNGGDSPHIALKNIIERLKMMCDGTIVISSREGGGTRAKITIPFSKKNGAE